ncbi:MAG: PilT/PilU family type 4a pilus ATPase [Pseudomonadota bacterium]
MREQEINHILSKILESKNDVSDINITAGRPFQVESSGVLKPIELSPSINSMTPFQTEIFALNLIHNDRRLYEALLREGSCDSSYQLPGKARFRVNIFSQRNQYSIVMRKLAAKIPTRAELGLPEVLGEIPAEKNGIIMVTGATGTGKTTTLAAILNDINENRAVHVVTLEDPIEYQHQHKKATFNQREQGTDFDTFANGLRAALRQAPKVILVGEMRDRESVEIALNASETGHLVLSTLHTTDAGQTINRILGMFNTEEEKLIRIRLAEAIKWIVSQRLLPKIEKGRVAAFEIMGNNLRAKESILNGEAEGKTFYEIIEASEPFGWTTFDSYIVNVLYKNGIITEETALAYSTRKGGASRGIDLLKKRRGEKTTDIDNLEIDKEYGKKDLRSSWE